MPGQHFTILDRKFTFGQLRNENLRIVAFFMVFQPFSDVLSISNTRQAIWQSNEKNLEH